MSGNRGKVLVAVVGVSLSALFLWLAVRNADLDAVRHALADARLGFVLLAVLALGVGYGFQAARWQRIADAPGLRLGSFYGMLLGGLACNNVLPVRIGELLRAGWLSRDAPMPGGRAFGSVVLDRICDVVTLTVFFAIGLQAVASAEWLVRLAVGAVLAVVVIAVALVLARVYSSRRRPRVGATPARSSRADPPRHGRDAGRADRAAPRGHLARADGVHLDPVVPRGGARRTIARHRPEPAGSGLRDIRARSGRRDPVVAGVHRDVPVARCGRAWRCSTSRWSRRSRSRFSCRRAGTCRPRWPAARSSVLRVVRGRPVHEPDPELG